MDDIPANRQQVLARTGLGSKASALARLGEPKRTATLVAVVRHLEAAAVDDTLDLLALLMATRLFSPARRASAEQRLAMLPRLEKASKTVARAGRVLLDQLAAAEDSGTRLDVAALWAAVERIAPRVVVAGAIDLVEELVPDDDGSADSAMRAALAGRYNTVRPFLTLLGESAALHAAPGGERVLAAVRALPELARRRVTQKPLTGEEIDSELVTPAWKRAVYASTELPAGAVDRDAYVVCVLEALHRALGRRDVYARPSHRWADPRALLLDGQRWEAVREDVLAGLSLTDPAPAHLARQLITLDAAWKQTAARLGEAGDDARARVVPGPNGRARLVVDHLDALDEPDSLVWLRATAQTMMPRVGRDGHPTPLGQAFIEYGRMAKTLHLLALVDPVDGSYQRRMNRQLTVQESRHRLGRKICHGHRGQIRQAYREGQEDQLAALGLVLNAVVLWNTRYLDAIVESLRGSGQPVRDEAVARLSPLGHAHLNCLGRYAFTTQPPADLRPLRDPNARDGEDDGEF